MGLKVEAVLTDNGRDYCGREERHPYELCLPLHDIGHRMTKVGPPQTNGFVERVNRTVLGEFLRLSFRTKYYGSLEELQKDLDEWLTHYNQGYRNMGKHPFDTVKKFIKMSRKKVD